MLGLKRTMTGEIALGAGAVRLVGYCTPKGRLLSSAWLGLYPKSSDADDRFALFISKDIAASTAKRLAMFVLRSKVKVTDASDDWNIYGAYHLNNQEQVRTLENKEAAALALQLPDVLSGGNSFKRILMAQEKFQGNDTVSDVEGLAQWNTLEVISAIPRIVLATQEQFVPQMINFESVSGVDFKKGCYPGQEIVARSQYRGAVKRRLQLAHLSDSPAALEISKPGTELFHSADATQPCGMVVLASRNADAPNQDSRIDLQVECKLEALENGQIHLGGADGPVLQIDTLPYPLIEI